MLDNSDLMLPTNDLSSYIEVPEYFYGRGTSDMKALDATWVDAMAALQTERLSAEAHDQVGADLR